MNNISVEAKKAKKGDTSKVFFSDIDFYIHTWTHLLSVFWFRLDLADFSSVR